MGPKLRARLPAAVRTPIMVPYTKEVGGGEEGGRGGGGEGGRVIYTCWTPVVRALKAISSQNCHTFSKSMVWY